VQSDQSTPEACGRHPGKDGRVSVPRGIAQATQAARIAVYLFIAWLAPMVLASVQLGHPGSVSFMADYETHLRSLVAIPLLLFAESQIDPAVRSVVHSLAIRDGVTHALANNLNPNENGDLPLEGRVPARPNEAYFRHVDQVVEAAAGLGLRIGMLPTWGDKVCRLWGIGPDVFDPAYQAQGLGEAVSRAFDYGQFLGRRYQESPHIIWMLGGDRPADGDRGEGPADRTGLGSRRRALFQRALDRKRHAEFRRVRGKLHEPPYG